MLEWKVGRDEEGQGVIKLAGNVSASEARTFAWELQALPEATARELLFDVSSCGGPIEVLASWLTNLLPGKKLRWTGVTSHQSRILGYLGHQVAATTPIAKGTGV